MRSGGATQVPTTREERAVWPFASPHFRPNLVARGMKTTKSRRSASWRRRRLGILAAAGLVVAAIGLAAFLAISGVGGGGGKSGGGQGTIETGSGQPAG